jgi:hypothetical protein
LFISLNCFFWITFCEIIGYNQLYIWENNILWKTKLYPLFKNWHIIKNEGKFVTLYIFSIYFFLLSNFKLNFVITLSWQIFLVTLVF